MTDKPQIEEIPDSEESAPAATETVVTPIDAAELAEGELDQVSGGVMY